MHNAIKKKAFSLLNILLLFALAAIIGACGGSTDSPDGDVVTTDRSSITLTTPANYVVYGSPLEARAILHDEDGEPLANTVVTFAASSNLVTFTPASTALTNSSGEAAVNMTPSDPTSNGAVTVTASATITVDGTEKTLTSAPIGVSVGGATVEIHSLTLGSPSISAYGTSTVSAQIYLDGAPTTVPISVTFTSVCVGLSKATITSPVSTLGGTAISTYKDNNCNAGTDTIYASVTGDTEQVTITVASPAASNIKFISAEPQIIGTSTASAPSLAKNSIVKFQVVDSSNNGKAGENVTFSILPASAPGGITFSPTSATSDTDGYVTTTVTSGTVPTPLWVVAALTSAPTIRSQSNTLTITTGLPAQNSFSLSLQSFNIEGWNYDGETSTITIIASDRLGNPVPDGTVINFITEGGQISPASCTTTSGTCTVTFRSAEYRPINETITVPALEYDGSTPITIQGYGIPLEVNSGRVTILAYAIGEKSFEDANDDNAYASGETFWDLGSPYIDKNENGTWESGEQYITYSASDTLACRTQPGSTPLPANYANVRSKENTCSAVWGQNYVRRSAVIVLSASNPIISQSTFEIDSCKQTFYFWLMDQNYNPMPAGTTVAIENASIFYQEGATDAPKSATTRAGGTPVLSTSHAGGTIANFTVDGGTGCSGSGVVPYPIGTADIVVTTPKGVKTYIGVQVINP